VAYDQKSKVAILFEVSKRNFANYYKDELQRVADGEAASQVIPKGARKTLVS